MDRHESQRLREELRVAMDLKEAANMKDPFTEHMRAPDKEALLDIVHTLDNELRSEHPEHGRIEKLMCLKESLHRVANVVVTPEEELWRGQLDGAVAVMNQA